MSRKEEIRENAQIFLDQKKSIEERRKFGQFATPFSLACEIVSAGLEFLKAEKISYLEPAFGTGAFYAALIHEMQISHDEKCLDKMSGIEIDPDYFNTAEEIWYKSGVQLHNVDFTRTLPDGKYNLVITNPPYVRHHYISAGHKNFMQKNIEKELGIRVSGLTGLYCYFLLLAHKWLAPGAICGWLIPSEFMDVKYGEAVKKYLLNKVHLLKIHRYAADDLQFSDALVSSCVVWFRNEEVDYDYDVEFSYGGTHSVPLERKLIRKSVLLEERKWTRFPEKEIRENNIGQETLGDYFTIKRGIATGDNNFFILDEEKINRLGIDKTFFRPILPSPRYLKTDFVKKDDAGQPELDRKLFLLDCQLPESEIQEHYPALWTYLQTGIPKTQGKYLCKNRKIWFWQEQRQGTHFFCSYMGRGQAGSAPVRFILSLSDAIATNSYLMLYPKENLSRLIATNPDSIFKIWEKLREVDANSFEDEGRVYGGGLRKIEPRELAKVACDGLRELCGS